MKKFVLSLVAAAAFFAFCAPVMAAAMNPFMDVPASHWAYDAVATLAARGVVSGYPDGSYKGSRPTTRYEMASAVARMLATVDMEKASKQDVEMLKRLVVEFKDELDALGVKVDSLDSRVAVLEKDLGGWALSGQLRFDAKFGNKNGLYGDYQDNANGEDLEGRRMVGKNQFDLNRYQIDIRKYINPTTAFFARLGNRGGDTNVVWDRYYIATFIPALQATLMVGHSELEWERDIDMIGDAESFVGRLEANMIALLRDFGNLHLSFAVARLNDNNGLPNGLDYSATTPLMPELQEQQAVIGKLDYQFNERARAGILAYYLFNSGDEKTDKNGIEKDVSTLSLGFYAGYKFNQGVELKGIYYYQKQGDYWRDRQSGAYYAAAGTGSPALLASLGGTLGEDKANMWRIMLDVKQDVLKYTSLWLEYGQMDNNFWRAGQNSSYNDMGHNILNRNYMPLNTNKTKFYGLRADQKWNDKWRTFVRYWQADYDTAGWDDVKNWGLGVGYRLNPAVEFELAYDHIDVGRNRTGLGLGVGESQDDHLIRFRTFVTF